MRVILLFLLLLSSIAPEPPLLSAPLAFQSNAGGFWNLYLMEIDGSVRALTDHPAGDHFLSWSADGEWINFLSARGDGETMGPAQVRPAGGPVRELSILTAVTTIVLENRLDWDPQPAPDGSQMVFVGAGTFNLELYVRDLTTGATHQLTRHGGRDWFPAWSPDGTQIAFNSDRGGGEDVYLIDAAGGEPRRLTDHPADDIRAAWSLDGREILFASAREHPFAGPVLDLYRIDPVGGDPAPLGDAPFSGGLLRSPDGTQVVFMSNHEGRWGLYLQYAACAADAPTCLDGARRLTDPGADALFAAWHP